MYRTNNYRRNFIKGLVVCNTKEMIDSGGKVSVC